MGEEGVDPSLLDESFSDGSSTDYGSSGSGNSGGSAAVSIGSGAASGAAAGSLLGPVGTAVGAVVGAGVGIYGAIESGNAQNKIDQAKAALEEKQADEVLYRARINEALRDQQAFATGLDVSSAQAGSGHEGGGISSQLEVKRQNDLQNMIANQEANFQAQMIKSGALMTSAAGNQAQTAGYIGAASSAVRGVGTILSPNAGVVNYGGTQSLPGIGQGFSA